MIYTLVSLSNDVFRLSLYTFSLSPVTILCGKSFLLKPNNKDWIVLHRFELLYLSSSCKVFFWISVTVPFLNRNNLLNNFQTSRKFYFFLYIFIQHISSVSKHIIYKNEVYGFILARSKNKYKFRKIRTQGRNIQK